MNNPVLVMAYDVGTTGIKTCLFEIDRQIKLLATEMESYQLKILENGGAEQDPQQWWAAMCSTTRKLVHNTGTDPGDIAGISFCSQMQGLVLVDREGHPVRPMMSYMDQRARQELQDGLGRGFKIAGINALKLLKSIRETGAVAASVKDPVWKYRWVANNEPALFDRVYKWLDVKEFLILRCTGEYMMTEDSAFATLLYNSRPGKKGWSRVVCSMFDVRIDHLPAIVRSTDRVGAITASAADALGLAKGTAVFGGGGDASLIGVGAGSVMPGDTHIYAGTSGWVSTVVDRPLIDTTAMIAAIVGAQPGRFNYFAELETAGKCLEWVRDHLALDEIGIYLEGKLVHETQEALYTTLYEYLTAVMAEAPPGSGGVIFTPWLHGNRCPFEDPNARGVFFNIGLDTGKTELIRAVVEGVCFHLRWLLEAQERKVTTAKVIRFVGGGALSDLTCQILADVLQREVETVERPQNVGAAGAAVVAAIGLGLIATFEEAKDLVAAAKTFSPDLRNRAVYERHYAVFKNLYYQNKKSFSALNSGGQVV